MLKLLRSFAFFIETNSASFKSAPVPEKKCPESATPDTCITERILQIYGALAAREKSEGLGPCVQVNSLFSELVGICVQTRQRAVEQAVLGDERIRSVMLDLRRICGAGEGLLETDWAERVVGVGGEDEVFQRLQQFPYFQNYIDLTKMELAAIQAVDSKPVRKIAFIGSGPLPLTSLCLLRELRIGAGLGSAGENEQVGDIEVLNIDSCPMALQQSRKLCAGLGESSKGMRFLQQQVGTISDSGPALELREFDVVYLAALVGSTAEEKERILVDVLGRMREGAIVVVRSARGLRGLMYPVFNVAAESVRRGGLEVGLIVHPYGSVFNSVVVGRVVGRGGSARKGER